MNKNHDKKIYYNLPNILTLIRLLLAIPLFIILVMTFFLQIYQSKILTTVFTILFMVIYLIAMTTDYFDGKYARKYHLVSNFGKLWDPVADKIITTLAFIYGIVMKEWIIAFIFSLFLIRDSFVAALRVEMSKNKIDVAAIKTAKWKTFLITIGIIIILIFIIFSTWFNVLDQIWIKFIINIPLICAAILAWISALQYYKKAQPYIKFANKK
ncbi:CDP-diacylglycerol--glycerol-3-phosphate 3-phosphatidyltransferase [Mycoplasma sp. 1018B]|uniref:CDP-diacylglycerol--glycerol-3-phosphate 3-phosphatidyltransferase n=1 Tax=Mycoplasma sp. 1018B TaxID=2967302 RepID=UPI00211CCEFD|nr:CDP-diacylglycerol--glycerol-3-phosphate 3-phosphatidyltransferase [Mycoplasma sp. 1018B]UUM19209.1 CDP-diacylglycerol--glycerol-3-phosphate 3-phosphatidyltransferase [Mycoplasma sp. 1018B]